MISQTVNTGRYPCRIPEKSLPNSPERYRNGFFTLNVHGHRINHDALELRGSGYVAKHRPDVLKVNDAWFRGVSLLYGHDGGVLVSDWCDDGECHDYDVIHRENGRLFKITFGAPKMATPDLARLPDAELVKLQLHKNEWHAGHARLLLQAYFETSDDRLISGIVLRENESILTIQTHNGTVVLPRREIASRQVSALSMMPEALLESLSPEEVLDLVAYLQSPVQVSLPKTE
ncbi:MAG: hypothetical protein HY735_08610 [Verrucomicrobia bacterium]|nr:hypothetical protein [Verrucomicrobiota bacterium]